MNSIYHVELSSQAVKFIKKLKDKSLLNEFLEVFEFLKTSPFSGKFLQGALKGYHSYRLRTYRIIYKIIHHGLLIYIEDIAHRKDIYR